MRRSVILIASLLLAAPAAAQDIEGQWTNDKRSI